MNTFEDYVQKFVDMTNKNEIIWQYSDEVYAVIDQPLNVAPSYALGVGAALAVVT